MIWQLVLCPPAGYNTHVRVDTQSNESLEMFDSIRFSIEPANLRDLATLQELEKTCFDSDAWSMLDLLGVLTFPTMVRYKAIFGQEIIGFAAGEIRRPQEVGWIITLGVHPGFRRQGVARALLSSCEEHMPVLRLRLCVRLSNHPAIDLYQKAGYQQIELWKQYYRNGEDAVVMEKEMPVQGTPLAD